MTEASDRLDRMEENLQTVTDLMVAVARRTESNAESIDQLTDNVDVLVRRVDQLAIRQEDTQAVVSQMASRFEQLMTVMVQFAQNAEVDRAEIRRIWEYLLGQQQNGNGRS